MFIGWGRFGRRVERLKCIRVDVRDNPGGHGVASDEFRNKIIRVPRMKMNKTEKLIKQLDEISEYQVTEKIDQIIARGFKGMLKEFNALYKSLPSHIQNNWIYFPGSSTDDTIGEGVRMLADEFKPGMGMQGRQRLLEVIRSFLLSH